MTLNLTSLPCVQGHWSRVMGMDGGTTDAPSECSGLEPAAHLEGRSWGQLAGQSISVVDLTSSRGMGGERGLPRCMRRHESDGRHRQWTSLFWYHSHLYSDITAIFILISQRWQVSADSVMWQLQPIKCMEAPVDHVRLHSGDTTALGGPPAAPPANVM